MGSLLFLLLGPHEVTRLGKLSLRVLKVIQEKGLQQHKDPLAFEASQTLPTNNEK